MITAYSTASTDSIKITAKMQFSWKWQLHLKGEKKILNLKSFQVELHVHMRASWNSTLSLRIYVNILDVDLAF